MTHAILTTVSERPGMLHAVTRVLAAHSADIKYVDIHAGDPQSEIYLEFTLPSDDPEPLLRDLREEPGVASVAETPTFGRIYGKRVIVACWSNGARERLGRVLPEHERNLTLRTVQHALARERGLASWQSLLESLDAPAAALKEIADEILRHALFRGDHAIAAKLFTQHPGAAKVDLYTAVAAGDLEDEYVTASPKVFREYQTNPSKRKYLKSNSADGTYYITMNLTQPPFDDVHVRKAMNWVMDKTGLIRAWGGSVIGEPATHILPPSLAPPDMDGYDPYATDGFAGDEDKAKEEMKQSKYDTDKDGICDAPECKGIINIMGTTARDKGMIPVIEASAAKIGVEFKTPPSQMGPVMQAVLLDTCGNLIMLYQRPAEA